ncbi:MAG: helix-turn-helix transcriptional regulator [Verrucomicrobia bacterium]|nr:helix-turn-helix transcriptional regulator [Verrucomicrobiota bacterium]
MTDTKYDFVDVIYILEGSAVAITGGIRHPLAKHNILIVPEGCCYRMEDSPQSPMESLSLCIQADRMPKGIFSQISPRQFRVLRHPTFAKEWAQDLRQLMYEQAQSKMFSPAMIVGMTLQLFAKLQRRLTATSALGQDPPAVHGPLAARVGVYVEELERTFYQVESLEMAAARLGMSPRHFTHLFKGITGATWLQYVRNLCLVHACKLLRDTNHSIVSICFECGFEDLSSFYRSFKQRKGISPQRWRMQNAMPRSQKAA